MAFHKKQVPLYVAYYRRAHPRFIRCREAIACLGPLTSISYSYQKDKHTNPNTKFDWRIDPEMSGGGLFMDVGCHVLDIMDFLFGRLENVNGDCHQTAAEVYPENLKVETVVNFTFRTVHDALGSAIFNFAAPLGYSEDILTICGVHGRVTMSIFGTDAPILHRPYQSNTGDIITKSKEIVCPPYPEHVHLPLVQCIVNDLRCVESGQVISSGESASRTAKIMDSILRRFYGNRNDDFWLRV